MSCFHDLLGPSGAGLSLGLITPHSWGRKRWVPNSVVHELWDVPFRLVERATIPGPVCESPHCFLWFLLLVLSLALASLLTCMPCYCWICPLTLHQRPRSLAFSSCSSLVTLTWSCELNSLLSLNSAPPPHLRESSGFCLSLSSLYHGLGTLFRQ